MLKDLTNSKYFWPVLIGGGGIAAYLYFKKQGLEKSILDEGAVDAADTPTCAFGDNVVPYIAGPESFSSFLVDSFGMTTEGSGLCSFYTQTMNQFSGLMYDIAQANVNAGYMKYIYPFELVGDYFMSAYGWQENPFNCDGSVNYMYSELTPEFTCPSSCVCGGDCPPCPPDDSQDFQMG